MTKSIPVVLPVRGHGQHIGCFSAATGSPSLFTADRVWARKHSELGNTALYYVEYWGESPSIAPGGTTILVESHVQDLTFELHPEAAFGVNPPVVTISGEELVCGTPEKAQSAATVMAKYQLHGSDYAGTCRVLIHARHPVVYISCAVKRLSKGPSGIPTALMVGFPGAVPQNTVTQFVDCRCRLDAGILSATPMHDPETQRARANAAYCPLAVAAMPVMESAE